MGLESTVEYSDDLNASWPLSSDTRREGDDHIRALKTALRNVCKNASGDVVGGPLLQAATPGGSIVLVPTTDNPNSISGPSTPGGTWTQLGALTYTPTGGGSATLNVWQLTGYPGYES